MLDAHDGTARAEGLPIEFLYAQIDMLRDEVAELRLELHRLGAGAGRQSDPRPGAYGRLGSVAGEFAALSARLDLLWPEA